MSHWNVFKINANSILTSNKALDAEKQSEYELILRCIDSGIPEGTLTKTFLLKVIDVNEEPTDIILSHDQVCIQLKLLLSNKIYDVSSAFQSGH